MAYLIIVYLMAIYAGTIIWMIKPASKRVVMTFFAFFFPFALLLAPVSSDLSRLANYEVIKSFDVAGMLDNIYFAREILFYLPFSFLTSQLGSVLGTAVLCGTVCAAMVWFLDINSTRNSIIVLCYFCSGFFFLGIGNITRQTLASYLAVIILHTLNKRPAYIGIIAPALVHNVGLLAVLGLFRRKLFAFAGVVFAVLVVNLDLFNKSVGVRQTGLDLVYLYMAITIALFIYFQWFNKIRRLALLCFFLLSLQAALVNAGFVIERISIFILTIVLLLLVGSKRSVSVPFGAIVSVVLFGSAYNSSVFKLLGVGVD